MQPSTQYAPSTDVASDDTTMENAAPAPASPNPPAPPAPAAAQPNPAANNFPAAVKPVRRSGLAGIVDEIRDALAGTDTAHIWQDSDGNKYVMHEHPTHGQQWAKIASEALHGAASGFAAGQGPSGHAKALAAGVGAGDKMAQEEKQNKKELEGEVRQDQLDKYNSIKLKHDAAAMEFSLSRQQIEAKEHDVQFSQSQIDREHQLGSADLGVYKDAADLANVKKQHPEFWKDVYANNIVTVPEVGEDGQRKGIHVFLRTPGVGSQLVDEGTKVWDYTPGDKPGDEPKLTQRTLAIPATHDQVDTWNNAALTKYQKYVDDKQKLSDEESQRKLRNQQELTSEAEARKADAEAKKALADTNTPAGDKATLDDNAEGLATGRYLMGKDIPIRTSAQQKAAAEYNRAANDYSMKKFGLPYSPELVRQEAHFAEDKHTQAYLDSLDKMIGSPGFPGQLDQVLDLAKQAGVGKSNALYQDARLWVKETYGEKTAKNFEQILSDTQSGLGSLIGNPLLGGGDSDLKLKTAQKQFGSNPTMPNLITAVNTAKEVLDRARHDTVKNNRYLMQRYGTQYLPPQAQTTQANNTTPDTHVFSKSGWVKTHPGQDVNKAIAEAQRQQYTVVD